MKSLVVMVITVVMNRDQVLNKGSCIIMSWKLENPLLPCSLYIYMCVYMRRALFQSTCLPPPRLPAAWESSAWWRWSEVKTKLIAPKSLTISYGSEPGKANQSNSSKEYLACKAAGHHERTNSFLSTELGCAISQGIATVPNQTVPNTICSIDGANLLLLGLHRTEFNAGN